MATSTYTDTAIQIWLLTAFSEVPKNDLIRRCCLIHLKNSSTCQRYRYSSATVSAGIAKLLVRKLNVLSVDSSQYFTRRSGCGFRDAESSAVSTMV